MFRRMNFGAIANGNIPAKRAVVAAEPTGNNPMSEFDYNVKTADGTGIVIGISGITDTESGKIAEISTREIVPIVAGGTLAIGDAVKADAEGKAVKASGTDLAFGVAIKDAEENDDVLVKIQ